MTVEATHTHLSSVWLDPYYVGETEKHEIEREEVIYTERWKERERKRKTEGQSRGTEGQTDRQRETVI